tara:strand:+ start:269 stop:490 length:222 start_codon:yes stop_codon:yes gene_type:complete
MKQLMENFRKYLKEAQVFTYRGDAQELIDHAESLGWEFVEDSYVDPSGMINWDAALDEATQFLKSVGWAVEYD